MKVTFSGQPLELTGHELNQGDPAPNTTVYNQAGEPVQLLDEIADVAVISVIPDITTSVCNLQTKNLLDESEKQGFQLITISKNTAEEFESFAKDNGLDLKAYSDKDFDFAKKYGLFLEDQEMTGRAVFVVKDGQVTYKQIVEEITDEPDYAPILEAVK